MGLLGGFEIDPDWFGPGASQLKPIIFLAYIILVYFILFNVFMAIVLDAYTMVWIVHGAAEAERGQKRNPMIAFLYAWYHQKWYGIALVKDLDDEAVRPEENCIMYLDNQDQKIGTAERIKSAARRLSASLIPG